MRKKDETLRDSILDAARDMASKNGTESISIRAIAKQTGIASGTVYNYFSCKDDILLALTEEYWRKTLIEMGRQIKSDTFCGQLEEIYRFLNSRIEQSAGTLMGSLRNVESDGRERMTSMQQVLCTAIIKRMDSDTTIDDSIWNDTFTKEKCAGFIIMNMMFLLQIKTADIGFFIEIVKRTIVRKER